MVADPHSRAVPARRLIAPGAADPRRAGRSLPECGRDPWDEPCGETWPPTVSTQRDSSLPAQIGPHLIPGNVLPLLRPGHQAHLIDSTGVRRVRRAGDQPGDPAGIGWCRPGWPAGGAPAGAHASGRARSWARCPMAAVVGLRPEVRQHIHGGGRHRADRGLLARQWRLSGDQPPRTHHGRSWRPGQHSESAGRLPAAHRPAGTESLVAVEMELQLGHNRLWSSKPRSRAYTDKEFRAVRVAGRTLRVVTTHGTRRLDL